MSPIRLRPYEEVKVQWSADERAFTLNAPWVSINVEVEASQRESVKTMADALSSEFLGFFADHPVAYVDPRKALEIDGDRESAIPFIDTPSPRELAARINNDVPELPESWSWDVERILADSLLESGSGYDPLSVYTILRRERLLAERDHKPNGQVFRMLEKIKERDEARFFEEAAFVLRQTYHVTNGCVPALAPALKAFAPARELVEKFINEERGHDLLVHQSLKAIGGSVDEIPVLAGTRLNMNLLRYTAKNHFLAFSCAVGYFEGSGYLEEDPMGRLLRSSSRPDGALGVQRHYMINKNGKHSAVGEGFAATMGAVDKQAVIAATRLNELLSLSGNSVTTALVKRFEAFV